MSIERVAKLAGVSSATVSRVLNDVPGVRNDLAAKVRAAISALSYDPADVKRGPRAGAGQKRRFEKRSGTIAAVTLGFNRQLLNLPVMSAVVQAIASAAKAQNMRLLLDEMPDLNDMTPVIRDREVDGAIVFMFSDASTDILGKLNRYIPIVWAMGGQAGPVQVDHVSPDNVAVGYLAHQYLKDRGCRNLAYLTREPYFRFSKQRGQAMRNAASEHGQHVRMFVQSDSPVTTDCYGPDVVARPTLEELIEAFANSSPRPDGLFVQSDWNTAMVHPLLAQHGIQPERDVILVSCDNEESRLSAMNPRPMSIEIGVEQIGQLAVRRLAARIERLEEPPRLICSVPSLPEIAGANRFTQRSQSAKREGVTN